MATALAAQLAQISANRNDSLDLKAQKAAHSKSLIFEPKVAASQSFHTLYSICRDGFDELCHLDARFSPFGSTIFSEQSRDEDRSQMTKEENAELDKRIDSFLRLVGSRLNLKPAIKALEWLIRRFRIHEYNTSVLITTLLPYHNAQIFATLLDILPSAITPEYRFLDPYKRSLKQPPRSALVHQATNHTEFLSTISEYTLQSCRNQQHYPVLISFWGSMTLEAVSGMLHKMRSGRRSVQKSNDQALLHHIGPVLSEALVMNKVPELQIASYMVIVAYASEGSLEDAIITALMEQVVDGWTTATLRAGLVCLSVLAQHKSSKQMSRKITKALSKVAGLPEILADIGKDHSVQRLSLSFCLALVDRLGKKGDVKGLPMVESTISKQILNEQQLATVFKSLLLTANKFDDEFDEDGKARQILGSTIVRLSQASGNIGETFAKSIDDTGVDVEDLEAKLGTVIRPKTITSEPQQDETTGEVEDVPMAIEDFDSGFCRLNRHSLIRATSCLLATPPDVFADLCSLYLSAYQSRVNLATFERVAALQRGEACKSPFFFTFFMRIWCNQRYPALARMSALDMVKGRLKSTDCKTVDFQALIPYCIAALSDPSKKVRRAAADLVTVVEGLYDHQEANPRGKWGAEKLYDAAEPLEWMSPEVTRRVLRSVLVPNLEECVLNADHVHTAVQSSLNSSGSRTSLDEDAKEKKGHLSHGARLSLLTFLAGHVVQTALLTVKLRLLRALIQVKSVSGTTRTSLLLPLLQWWVSLSVEETNTVCSAEDVDPQRMDQNAVEVVLPNDKAGLDFLLEAAQLSQVRTRKSLLHEIFVRISKMWPSMKSDAKLSVAEKLLELTRGRGSDDQDAVANEAADLLKSVELNADIFLSFLDSLKSVAKLALEVPSNKRRRLSSSESMEIDVPPTKRRRSNSSGSMATDSPSNVQRRATSSEIDGPVALGVHPELSLALKQVTFVLQLVEGSDPGKHPELLDALFNALSELQQFRALIGSEHGYLQKLVLDSLLSMMPAYESDKTLKIDHSGGYGDLLVNCVQKSSSPAVQKAALLLVAKLANVAPDLVLHSVMPIFTFMGTSVLRQSDDYSAHVINQTVEQVVPPLIASLRRGKRSPVAGAAEILLSFVTAFEHIPSHRRMGLFVSLVKTAGPEDFLFALLAMLVNKYGSTSEVLSFSSEVFNYFGVEILLQSLVKLVGLIGDIFQPKRTLSAALLGLGDDSTQYPQTVALFQLNLLVQVLSSRKLASQVSKLTSADDMDAAKVRELYSNLLKDLLSLAETLKPHKPLHARCGDALSKLLNLLSIGEFLKSVETLLDRPDAVIRRKVLRAVEDRIDQERQGDADSRAALLAFLPQLTAVIRTSDDMPYKHIAVECVDKIAEKYGKKDPEAVTAAAETIAGDQCLGQADARLRIMALCCLSSLVDVLQDGIVQVLPSAIPKCISYMRESIEGEKANAELHNASYGFMTALAQHLPYMLTQSYLKQLLAASSASAEAGVGGNARLECLQSLAKQIDAKVMFSALEGNWTVAASGFTATKEYLDVLGVAIDKHSKSIIAKNAQLLSNIFFSVFDLRRQQHVQKSEVFTPTKLSRIEDAANAVALRMIFKLNDASFRPIFSQLMDWAVALPASNIAARDLRLYSVFSFLVAFFDSLKAAVTSYASYVVDVAVSVLKTAQPKDVAQRDLRRKALQCLTKCFEHDNDDIKFWQAPAHFSAVAPVLTSQFAHAASGVDLSHDLFPAIIELAAAADSRDHWKELNGALLKHLRSEHASVRLAAVKCEQALWERLGSADEWQDLLPETGPYLSELQEDDDEEVERETHRWIVGIEEKMGTQLDSLLQ